MRDPRDKLDGEQILDLVRQNLSPAAIATKLGCSRQGVHNWAKRQGIKISDGRPGRPPTDEGRIVCLKLKVPLAVKRWASQNLDKVQILLVQAYKNPGGGDIWEDVYPDQAPVEWRPEPWGFS